MTRTLDLIRGIHRRIAALVRADRREREKGARTRALHRALEIDLHELVHRRESGILRDGDRHGTRGYTAGAMRRQRGTEYTVAAPARERGRGRGRRALGQECAPV